MPFTDPTIIEPGLWGKWYLYSSLWGHCAFPKGFSWQNNPQIEGMWLSMVKEGREGPAGLHYQIRVWDRF